jgi:hypothetical protein
MGTMIGNELPVFFCARIPNRISRISRRAGNRTTNRQAPKLAGNFGRSSTGRL